MRWKIWSNHCPKLRLCRFFFGGCQIIKEITRKKTQNLLPHKKTPTILGYLFDWRKSSRKNAIVLSFEVNKKVSTIDRIGNDFEGFGFGFWPLASGPLLGGEESGGTPKATWDGMDWWGHAVAYRNFIQSKTTHCNEPRIL